MSWVFILTPNSTGRLIFHIQIAITKSQKALQAIKIFRKHFTKKELLTLVISNYYSIIFYNSEVWLIPSLTNITKNCLLSASAKPLKICYPAYNSFLTYEVLHQTLKRATHFCSTRYTIWKIKIQTR